MKLSQLFEMPQLTDRELDGEKDGVEPMKPFVITTQRYMERYDQLAQDGNVVVAISKTHNSAIIATKTIRHDKADGFNIVGILELKENPQLGFPVDPTYLKQRKMLQVNLVTVADEARFMGVGSFLYSSLAQAGFTVISDTHQFKGGKELWKKLARARRKDEVVYILNKGKILTDEHGPIEYNGENIPDNEIWSSDEQHKYVLLIYKVR